MFRVRQLCRVGDLLALAGERESAWARRLMTRQGHQYGGPMAHITGHLRIAAPIAQVFDTVADSRNEPSFNPAMTGVELLTAPPIGLGTRFRAHMGKAGMEMLVELTEFEPPHRLSSEPFTMQSSRPAGRLSP